MEIIREFINVLIQTIPNANAYAPRGRNPVETELKLSCYQSLIQCTTLVYQYYIFVPMLESKRGRNLFRFREFSFIDSCCCLFVCLFYFVLFAISQAFLVLYQRYNRIFVYIVLGMLVIFLGHLFEYGWYFSKGDWLANRKFLGGSRFQELFFIPCFNFYQVCTCVIAIRNFIHAELQLKEYQQILDSLPKFKFNSSAARGG